nr:MAG TPA: hypothetical protein [Crassvirales sp.]DAX21871.1 MAG TPA: hypothetical protein [Caudoviricetes sp.]
MQILILCMLKRVLPYSRLMLLKIPLMNTIVN